MLPSAIAHLQSEAQVAVKCGPRMGMLSFQTWRITCDCQECSGRAEAQRSFSGPQWEAHGGKAHCRKWRSQSVRVIQGLPAGVFCNNLHAPSKFVCQARVLLPSDQKESGCPVDGLGKAGTSPQGTSTMGPATTACCKLCSTETLACATSTWRACVTLEENLCQRVLTTGEGGGGKAPFALLQL